MSVITIPDPTVPRLLTLDEDPIPERKSLGDPAALVPPSAWIADPNASCRTVHLANEVRPGVGDMSRLRGRVLLAIELPGKTIVLLLHPEVAAGWAHGLSVAVQGAMELPPTPTASEAPAPASEPEVKRGT